MKLSVAIRLIEKGVKGTSLPQRWADLGAGNGLFTHALASILPVGSSVDAIDKNDVPLDRIKFSIPTVAIRKIQKDFVRDIFELDQLDGILMANSLHYVSDKVEFLRRIKKKLNSDGRMILVEYDRDAPTPWVPFPVNLEALKRTMSDAGFSSVIQIGEEPSVYRQGMMYSAAIG